MDAKVPKCPRCKGGGSVKFVSPEEDKEVFSTPPAKNTMQLFQCTVCGWTIVTSPQKTRPNLPGQAI
jgi:hypothetical protein